MTSDRIRLPDVSDDTNDLVNHLLNDLRRRQPGNLRRAAYYDAKRNLRTVTSIIPKHYFFLGIVLGWTGKAVDLLARRCHLEAMVWPDGDLDSLGMNELWDSNYLGSEIDTAITASLLHGPAYLINTSGQAGEPESLIHVKDALDAIGDWNPRARRLNNLLTVTQRGQGSRVSGLSLYLPEGTLVAEKDTSGWQTDFYEHPFNEVPAEVLPYNPQVRKPFGCSRITRPMMGIQDQATRELVRLEGHMDVWSFPEMLMLGADMSIFKNADGSQKDAFEVMLGRWKGIPDDEDAVNPRADVKQFAAASPEPHLNALNAFAKLFAREGSLPDTALAITDVSNPTSAESYDASQYELIAEAEGATDDWSPAIRRSVKRGLAILEGLSEVPEEWRSIDTKWRDPRYQSRAAKADAGMKQLASVGWLSSTEVGLELLGLDDQQIRRALAAKRKADGQGVLDALRAAAAAGPPTPQAPAQEAPQEAPEAGEGPQEGAAG